MILIIFIILILVVLPKDNNEKDLTESKLRISVDLDGYRKLNRINITPHP